MLLNLDLDLHRTDITAQDVLNGMQDYSSFYACKVVKV